jgi:hypothetical protein
MNGIVLAMWQFKIYRRDLSSNKVASGIYFYVLEATNSVFAEKLVLLQ